MIPYEIWVVGDDGQDYPLITFTDEAVLDDTEAKTAAVTLLTAISEKIAGPAPDALAVKRGLITGPALHMRVYRRTEKLIEE